MSDQKKLRSPHPWRLCPYGEHWVREHDRRVPISPKNPTGITQVAGHCRINPSQHEILVRDEIQEIARVRINEVKLRPSPDDLGFPKGNNFDDFIGLWTQFWNEIFDPEVPLDPDIVKALVAQESGFKIGVEANNKIKNVGKARGLIQITEQTRKILADSKGELKDYLVVLSKKDLSDPNLNLAGGIRWLFHKRDLLSKRLKRSVTWEDAILEYKGVFDQVGRVQTTDRIKKTFEEWLARLKSRR